MRKPCALPWLPLLLLLLTGCIGGLSNDPYLPGETAVEGVVEGELDSKRAWVAIVESEMFSPVDSEGRFAIAGVPVGTVELAASSGLGLAISKQVLVLKDVANQYTLVPGPGASVTGVVALQGGDQRRRIDVGIVGLPVHGKTLENGRFELLGLPAGSYQLWAGHPTHKKDYTEVELTAGEQSSTDLVLSDEERPPGLLCAPCQDQMQCLEGLCVTHRVGELMEKICSRTCQEGRSCPPGFICGLPSGGQQRVCLPAAASCAARENLGAPCTGDDLCGLAADDGICYEQVCTVPCLSREECPNAMDCVANNGPVRVCF